MRFLFLKNFALPCKKIHTSMMNFTIVLVILAFVSVQSVSLNNNVAARTVAALICVGSPCFADADVMDTKNIDFNSWLSEMSEGNVESVIFKGINPSSLTSKLKSGVSVLVRDGFPVEDSLSPSILPVLPAHRM